MPRQIPWQFRINRRVSGHSPFNPSQIRRGLNLTGMRPKLTTWMIRVTSVRAALTTGCCNTSKAAPCSTVPPWSRTYTRSANLRAGWLSRCRPSRRCYSWRCSAVSWSNRALRTRRSSRHRGSCFWVFRLRVMDASTGGVTCSLKPSLGAMQNGTIGMNTAPARINFRDSITVSFFEIKADDFVKSLETASKATQKHAFLMSTFF